VFRYLSVALCATLLLGAGAAQAVSKRELQERIIRLERLMEQQSEIFLRLQKLQDEVRSIRGELEVQGYKLEKIQRRQREIYRDLDDRIGKLERATEKTTLSGDAEGSATEPDIAAGMEEQQAYQQAFGHLRKLEYPEAVSGFAEYLKRYPEGRYAAKAQYWLGEIRYVRGAYQQAITEYRKLIERYPDNAKVPEAMLKIGLSYQELGKRTAARKQFSELIVRFPDSPEAEEARKYLKKK